MRVRSIARPKLPHALAREGAFRVAARAGETACAGHEDGFLAGGEGLGWDEEDKLEACGGGHPGL